MPNRSPPRRRLWLCRLAAIAFGLALLAGFEGLCRLCYWGRPELHDDPFVGFQSIWPLFVLSEDGQRYEIPKSRQGYFCPQTFSATKPNDEYRIFCLGGSTVQGRPYAVETSFTTWLEISLRAAAPRRRWKVVNCGGVSYASYRLRPILEEVLHYDPDLIVLCTGHNEFLESRGFDHIRDRGGLLNASLAGFSRLHTFNLMRDGYLRLRGAKTSGPPAGRPVLPAEVETLLDYRGGLAEYHRDETWRRNVIEQFRFNLQCMVRMARDAKVDILLMNPACNLGDMPPFKAEHRADLSDGELAEWEASLAAARGYFRRESHNLRAAIPHLERACQIDPVHAGAWYTLAECYRAAGRWREARAAFTEAKELDVCPLRILQPMTRAILDLARQTDVPLVDVQKLFERGARHGIVGSEQLVDHVHPSFAGHQHIADALANKLVELGHVQPVADWQANKRRAFQKHLDGLDGFYYALGERRLKNLRLWTQGRSKFARKRQKRAEDDSARGQK